MIPNLLPLGPVPLQGQIVAWLLTQSADLARRVASDPTGVLHRVGDLLVWDGPKGHAVLATLEGLGENQNRIAGAVEHIGAAQLVLQNGLGVVAGVSLFHLGLTTLTSGLMLHRLHALQRRLAGLQQAVQDIQAHLNAMTQAPIEAALTALDRYDRGRPSRGDELRLALVQSDGAAAVYKKLVLHEVGGRRRLPMLNHSGRCYMLALLTHARCLVLDDALADAQARLEPERSVLKDLATATFDEVLGKAPETYLDPALKGDNVSLELLAGVYQQARRVGVVTATEAEDAAGLFEHLRSQIYGAGRGIVNVFGLRGKARQRALERLRYLMACLEEVNRVEAMRLRIDDAITKNYSLRELEQELTQRRATHEPPGDENPATAVGFAFA